MWGLNLVPLEEQPMSALNHRSITPLPHLNFHVVVPWSCSSCEGLFSRIRHYFQMYFTILFFLTLIYIFIYQLFNFCDYSYYYCYFRDSINSCGLFWKHPFVFVKKIISALLFDTLYQVAGFPVFPGVFCPSRVCSTICLFVCLLWLSLASWMPSKRFKAGAHPQPSWVLYRWVMAPCLTMVHSCTFCNKGLEMKIQKDLEVLWCLEWEWTPQAHRF